ncbi:hypothetical protein K7432_012763 [Basidiobolus ranarum]|uniref:Cytochrome P450 n=1 Tax=Basidiobolus ranarum TaxID=34480 RepID=A0ABR2VRS0_9FUNG
MVTYAYEQDWKLRRDIINQQFRLGWEPAKFCTAVFDFFNYIDSVEVMPDLYHIMELMTLDTLGNVLFGFDFEAIRKPEGEHISTYFHAVKAALNVIYIAIPILEKLPSASRAKGHMAVKEFRTLLGNLAIARAEEIKKLPPGQESISSDLLTVLAKSWLDKRLELEEVVNEMIILIIAGHDTTASTLSCAIYFLARHPDIQAKVREEISGVFEGHTSTMEAPTSSQIKSLCYLEAVIKETMRFYPPTPLLLTHTTAEDTYIGNIPIPKDTLINMNMYAMHRSEEYWDSPNMFQPQRWISEDGNILNPSAWGPFADGSRICIGKGFAMTELKIDLAMIVRRYNLSFLKSDTELQFEAEMIFKPKNLSILFTKIVD